MTQLIKKGLGWRPDVPDIRDARFTYRACLRSELMRLEDIPTRYTVGWDYTKDNIKTLDDYPVHDQGQTSSCTGQSTETMISLESGLQPRSRLQLYWQGRAAIGETRHDNGAFIRDVIKGTADVGAGAEKYWPFDADKVCQKPNEQVLESAAKHKVASYHRLQTRQDFLSCLAQDHPFVIGFTVYADFVTSGGETERTGVLNIPHSPEANYGGHAVCVVGFDNDFRNSQWGQEAAAKGVNVPNTVYIVRNSWGKDWGRNGNFAVDSNYFENLNLADDAWTIRMP